MYYDVNCQYIKNLYRQIDWNLHLEIDPRIELTAGICKGTLPIVVV
jgi:hypothetical protein